MLDQGDLASRFTRKTPQFSRRGPFQKSLGHSRTLVNKDTLPSLHHDNCKVTSLFQGKHQIRVDTEIKKRILTAGGRRRLPKDFFHADPELESPHRLQKNKPNLMSSLSTKAHMKTAPSSQVHTPRFADIVLSNHLESNQFLSPAEIFKSNKRHQLGSPENLFLIRNPRSLNIISSQGLSSPLVSLQKLECKISKFQEEK